MAQLPLHATSPLNPLVEEALTRFRDAGHGQDDIMAIVHDIVQRSGVDLTAKKSS